MRCPQDVSNKVSIDRFDERKAVRSIKTYKARLVAKGFRQKYGIDYTETFSPVVKYATMRMVIAIAKHFGWPLDQLDVVTAFLYGVMKKQVFCVIHEGVKLNGDFDCLELMQAVYGLKQASRIWNETFAEFVRSIDFRVSALDTCLYIMNVRRLCATPSLRGRCAADRKFTRADCT